MKTKTFTVKNIKWDTDGRKVKLPKTLKIAVQESEYVNAEEIDQFISDEISNITGYCHTGFDTVPKIK